MYLSSWNKFVFSAKHSRIYAPDSPVAISTARMQAQFCFSVIINAPGSPQGLPLCLLYGCEVSVHLGDIISSRGVSTGEAGVLGPVRTGTNETQWLLPVLAGPRLSEDIHLAMSLSLRDF